MMLVSFAVGLTLLVVGVSSELTSLPQLISKWTHSHSDHWEPRELTRKPDIGFGSFPFLKAKPTPQPQALPVEFSTFEQRSFAEKNQAVASMVDEAFRSGSFKEVSEMPVRGAGNLRATLADYSSTGSVYMSTFMNEDGSADSTCSNMNAVAGAYVNYCFVVESYAFKFQIVSDNCAGAVIEYYNNTDCTSLFGAVELQVALPADTCMEMSTGSGVYGMLQCTTSSTPVRVENGILIKSFQDAECNEEYGLYSSVANAECQSMGSGMYANYGCSGDNAMVHLYQSLNCTGSPLQSANLPAQCLNQDSIDDYYLNLLQNPPNTTSGTPFPGMEPVQMSMQYTCRVDGRSSSSSDSLGDGAVAGIVVGSVVGFVLVVAAIAAIVVFTGAGAGVGAAASAPAAVV